ncbi:MAG: S9 family peptidase, partial [Pseudomonadota bacterium]|nr:S9 family peptidase [Pseudomonadota bacterium]
MRSTLPLLALLLSSACATVQPAPPAPVIVQDSMPIATAPAAPANAIATNYPDTRRMELSETQFGTAVADPYRWLENDVREDKEVAAWVASQNVVTDAFLDTLPLRDTFKARMTELYDYERFGVPRKEGGRYFYSRNDGLQNQSVLYVREAVDGEGRVLIDPNGWSQDGATALAEWVPSEDGTKLLYSIQDGGTDWRTLKILDVATGQVAADEIKWVKFSDLSWAKDGSGFYYSRFAEPQAGQTFQSLNKDQKIYFHRLGTAQSADRLVYATPAAPDLSHSGTASDDGKWLVVTSSSGTDDRYEVTLIDLARPAAKPRTLIPGFTDNFSYIGNRGSTFYFQTNKGAPRLKVVAIDIARPGTAPRILIDQDAATLSGVSLVGGSLVAAYLVDAKTEIRVHDLNGRLRRKVELPGIGTAGG